MTDLAKDRVIRDATQKLVADVSRRWPEEYMRPIQADMQYGQYAEAVLNLIAVSHNPRFKLSKSEVNQIHDLVGKMSIEDDVKNLAKYLRDLSVKPNVEDDESVMAFLR